MIPKRAEPDVSRKAVVALWIAAIGVAVFLTLSQKPRRAARPDASTLSPRDLAPIGIAITEGWGGPGPPPVGGARPGGGSPAAPLHPAPGYRFRRLLCLGDPVPQGGAFAGDLEISALNNAGQALIVSEAESGEALYLIAPDRIDRVITPGKATPEGTHYGGSIWTPQSINNSGQVVWAGQLDNGETWTFFYNARSRYLGVVARPGMDAPGGGAFQPAGRQRPVINDLGDIAFVAHVLPKQGSAPVPGIFYSSDRGLEAVAREGMTAPGGTRFTAAEAPAINDAGEIVFHATVAGSDALGVYRWRDGVLSAIAVPGSETAGGTRHLTQAFYPQIDAAGDIVFVGRTRLGDGLYRWSRGAITLIVERGDRIATADDQSLSRAQPREPTTDHFLSSPARRAPRTGHRLEAVDLTYRYPFRLNAAGAVAFLGQVGEQSGVFLCEQEAIRAVALSDVRLAGIGVATAVGNLGGRASSPDGLPGAGMRGPGGSLSPAGGPAGFGGFGSFGLALSDDGKLLFAANLDGHECVILATPAQRHSSARR